MARSSFGLAALAVTFAAIGGAHAMTLSSDNANIVDLMQQSNDIVVGRVDSVTDGLDDRGIPYTEVTLKIAEAIRGGISGDYKFRQFGLLTPRLTADGKRKMMPAPPGFPKYTAGEDICLFLRPRAAWTGFRMPAGVTGGKFTIAAGRVENGMGNVGLFRNVQLDQGLVQEGDKRLLTTAGGPVNPDAFLSFVRRAVQDHWVESGRMTRVDRKGGLQLPPPSGAHGEAPAAQPPAPNPQAALLDPKTNIALPGPRR
jgi:hypothetical protein